VARIDDLVATGLKSLPAKPADTAKQAEKKRYSELASQALALAFAEELRQRGMKNTRPAPAGELDQSGAERRMAGGIGAKKVDVTWTTEESGLLFAISIKTINFSDGSTGNYQKNLTNRRSDMLIEAVTLHRRFPYAVLAGFMFLDKGAELDSTSKRRSTFVNAHNRMKLFTGRPDPAGRDEQFERLYLFLMDASPDTVNVRAYPIGELEKPVPLSGVFDDLVRLVAERNPDFYEEVDGNLVSARS
jgi:hypothetical protein